MEHSVDQDGETELPDGFPDALVLEADPALLPSGACRWETAESDAWADVLPGAMPDGSRERLGAGAEKLVDPALDVLVQAGQALLIELRAARHAEVLCTPDAAPSAA